MIDTILGTIRRYIPNSIFSFFQPIYHWKLSFLAALIYRFPSRKIKVIAVTGTKGKSSTVEIINAILQEAGFKTAVSNTIRFKIADESRPNLHKMTMPGRFAIQRLIRQAVNNKCDYVVIEMTSQGALLYRHLFIDLDILVFTNLSPEHIEAHGSYENYVSSKLEIARALSKSNKPDTTLIVNRDEKESPKFLECNATRKISYGIKDAEPYVIKEEGIDFTIDGKKYYSPLSGLFNLYNILAAITVAKSQGVNDSVIERAISRFDLIPGRVHKISAGQDFQVVVDYAHTADSLTKLYEVFKDKTTICVLGGTGGGRDTWKRKEMGKIADTYCSQIFLTDEDPYDEDPKQIIDQVAEGITNHKPTIIMDRRKAIHEALKTARNGDIVLITGKGTDPYIMGPKGSKIPWSDEQVVREEIEILKKTI